MSTGMLIVRTLSEIAVVLTLIFGFLRENRLLKWERKAVHLMRSLRKKARDAREQELEKELLNARYADEYVTDRSSRTQTQADRSKRRASRDKVA